MIKLREKNPAHKGVVDSIVAALVIALAFYLNDWFDHILDKKIKGHSAKHIKLGLHAISIFIITFVATFTVYNIFTFDK